jgi:hypothetical protein
MVSARLSSNRSVRIRGIPQETRLSQRGYPAEESPVLPVYPNRPWYSHGAYLLLVFNRFFYLFFILFSIFFPFSGLRLLSGVGEVSSRPALPKGSKSPHLQEERCPSSAHLRTPSAHRYHPMDSGPHRTCAFPVPPSRFSCVGP